MDKQGYTEANRETNSNATKDKPRYIKRNKREREKHRKGKGTKGQTNRHRYRDQCIILSMEHP